MQCSNQACKGEIPARLGRRQPSECGTFVDPPILGTPSPIGGWRYAHYDGIVASAVWFWFRSSHGLLAEKRRELLAHHAKG
jgi:hypothetical protein